MSQAFYYHVSKKWFYMMDEISDGQAAFWCDKSDQMIISAYGSFSTLDEAMSHAQSYFGPDGGAVMNEAETAEISAENPMFEASIKAATLRA